MAPEETAPQAAKMEEKPAEESVSVAIDDCGLAVNSSLEDSEVLDILAPAEALAEEMRLQKEREEEERKCHPKVQELKLKALEGTRFAALEHMLKQSEAYTQFLAEQMKDIDRKTDAEAAARAAEAAGEGEGEEEEAPAPSKGAKGGKKKGGKRARAATKSADEKPAKQAKTLTPTEQLLPLMNIELRDYQLKGVKWLISLYQNGINGILADQMGLGKTAQTIGLMAYMRNKTVPGPFMVVGPLSTLPNWVNEFNRFLPSCPALLYHGSKAEREQLRATRLKSGLTGKDVGYDFPVIITSYEIVIADSKFFSKMKFKYIVVDEGHRLKNFNCKLIRELKTIPTENKLLLSGTPLQNNLAELWSLLNFLMPDVFARMDDFEEWFDFSSVVGLEGADQEIVAAEQRNKVVSKLHAILKPFVLRRLKSDVEISLPRKMELVLYAGMTDVQKQLNQQMVDGKLLEEMRALAEREGSGTSSVGKLNNVLMQMRKNCNHPDLITSAFTNDINYPPPDQLVADCGKMQLLDRLLTRLHANGHKVLIFSQMTKVLDLIQSYLEQRGHDACRIDGSIKWQDRQAAIKAFNEDKEPWVFLLSTRAGGLGINLTSADTVIIYDSDWNPHQDMQAMDRCHRIGQTKPVLVFRLATANSVEGKMLKRAADKMVLERLVIKKGAFKGVEQEEVSKKDTSLSAAELLELLEGDYKMDDVPQSGVVSDEMLEVLLDRSHLERGNTPPFPETGVGYEVVQVMEGSAGLLQNINN